jgi:anaerobic selenocysteine-containing dehydrogenase
MQPFSNLAQHMIDCLNMICGRYLRAGEKVHRTNVLEPIGSVYAEVIPPMRGWESGGPSRIRGARVLYGERPTGTLTDEILTPGSEQIRALILGGGNPLTSFPDQRKAAEAMQAIELLVSIDPWPGPGASYAHYILPPTLQYERADLPLNLPGYALWPGCWSQYTPAILEPPPGSDLIHDWYAYWAIAKRLGRTIHFNGQPLRVDSAPTCDEILSALMRGGPVTLDQLKRHPHGMIVDLPERQVQPPRPEARAYRFDPMPTDVAEELLRFLAVQDHPGKIRRGDRVFSHLLSSRRMRDMFNSNGSKLRSIRKRTPYNPAFLNPLDLESLGLEEGDRVELVSAHGRVLAIVGRDPDLRPGVVSMAHGWGALPDDENDPSVAGSSVNALIDTDINFESINAMPHMTAVPINIVPLKKIGALPPPGVAASRR